MRRTLITVHFLVKIELRLKQNRLDQFKLNWSKRYSELIRVIKQNSGDNELILEDLKTSLIVHFSENIYTGISSLKKGLLEPISEAQRDFSDFMKQINKSQVPHLLQLLELKENSDLKKLKSEISLMDFSKEKPENYVNNLNELSKDIVYFNFFKQHIFLENEDCRFLDKSIKFERNENLDRQFIVFLKKKELEIQKKFQKVFEIREKKNN